ncbi:MAG: arginine--tRNA ligase [Clostridia bacterium]|nr:arginine--tRNA ligase [Clostridia bacterium]
MDSIKLNIAEAIAKVLEKETDEVFAAIETPKDSKMGDFAYPCFKLASVFKKAPVMIANNIKEKLGDVEGVSKVEVVAGYLNFFADNTVVVETTVKNILNKKDACYNLEEGVGKTICIDYSSPNIAKPFHIGHLRSTVIGSALVKIYKALGYNVVGINHLGDFGTQFGYVIEGYKRFGQNIDLTEEPIKKLVEIYVKINEMAKEDEAIVEKARENFARLEAGDEEIVALWSKFRELSLEEYKRIYDILGITFDSYNGEAFYNDKMGEVVDMLRDSGKLVPSEGAQVVELETEKVPCMILKTNGSTTYATRDLAAILYRARTYDYTKCLYLTGYEQNLHFKQIFETAKYIVDEKYVPGLVHVPFGMVLGPGGKKLSTRKGASTTIKDVIDEAIEKAKQVLEAKGKTGEEAEKIAKAVGIGAVIFNDLKNNRIKDEIFDLDEMLKFEGETGPYVQYTYVRTNSIINKAGYEPTEADVKAELLTAQEEIELIKLLALAPNMLKQAANENEPSVITRYIIDVASAFSKYYNECQIIVEDEALRKARLALVKATGYVLKNGLNMLGIEAPEKM